MVGQQLVNGLEIIVKTNNITPDTIGVVSKTQLNLTHFYTNSNFLLGLWKDLADPNPKQC